MRWVAIGLVLHLALALGAPARAEDAPPDDSPLAAVGFLAGEFTGEGRHAGGAYEETFTGTWILAGTALEIRSKSTMGGQTVFEDLRVISWDASKKRLRLRQFARGGVRVFASPGSAGGSVVFEQTAYEGPPTPTWRYTFTPGAEDGFSYEVHTKQGDAWTRFVGGTLGTQLKDPGKGGGLGIRQYATEIDGMAAEVHHPDGEGPYPVIVFSPGGAAGTVQGYGPYGRWFATWGYVTVIVAFDDESATERAPKFTKVIDWAVSESTRDGSPLEDLADPERIAVAGHSRGAHAALLAGRGDERVDAALALAPSGPEDPTDGENEPASLIVIGDQDEFLETAKKAYAAQPGEHHLIEVQGLGHMLREREPVLKLVARSTAFLNHALAGDKRYKAVLLEPAAGLSIESAE